MQTTELELAQPPAASVGPMCPASVTVITPPRGWQLLNLRELWSARELLMFLTWRDVMVRYKQTVLGAAWAILQPAMMMVVFTVFLGRLAKVDSGDVPYPVFVYAGLLPWTFFATAISNAGNSVIGSSQMVSKIYFPRLLIPMASVAAAVVDFLIAFLLLAGLMVYYRIMPGWGMLLLPLLLLLATIAALGVGVLLAALNVAYRDFKYTIPFLVQIWMFATPAVYMNVDAAAARAATRAHAARAASASQNLPSPIGRGAGGEGLVSKNLPSPIGRGVGGEGLVSPKPSAAVEDMGEDVGDRAGVPPLVKALLRLNPMTGLIAFFRAATLGGPLPWSQLGYASAVIALMLVVGLAYFRRVESTFADII